MTLSTSILIFFDYESLVLADAKTARRPINIDKLAGGGRLTSVQVLAEELDFLSPVVSLQATL